MSKSLGQTQREQHLIYHCCRRGPLFALPFYRKERSFQSPIAVLCCLFCAGEKTNKAAHCIQIPTETNVKLFSMKRRPGAACCSAMIEGSFACSRAQVGLEKMLLHQGVEGNCNQQRQLCPKCMNRLSRKQPCSIYNDVRKISYIQDLYVYLFPFHEGL